VHVERLCALLDERPVDYVVYNATSGSGDGRRVVSVQRGRRTWLLRYVLAGKERAVYVLSARLSAWLLAALMARLRGKRVLLRLRNDALTIWCARFGWKRFCCRWALNSMHAVICVNEELIATAADLGVPRARLHHFPGFLPPVDDPADRTGLPADVTAFLDKHHPVIVANGKVNWHGGQDLYGFDQLIELAGRLHDSFPNVGMLICFADYREADAEYVARLRARAADLRVAPNVLLHTQPGRFLPVLAAADVFVRPTTTDGDANSLREALALGVPSVASDAVARPASTYTFATRDLDDLERQTRTALRDGAAQGAIRVERPARLAFSDADQRRFADYVALLAQAAGCDIGPDHAPEVVA
jgi:glycosyltransferase involved in cell wall biosynthesis